MSLPARTTFAVMIPVLGCLAAFGYYAYEIAHQAVIDGAVRELEGLATVEAARIERLVDQYGTLTVDIAEQVRERSFEGERTRGVAWPVDVADLADRHSEIVSVTLFDSDSDVAASTSAPVVPDPSRDRRAVSVQPVLPSDGSTPFLVGRGLVRGPGEDLIGGVEVRFAEGPIRSVVENAAFGGTGEVLLGTRDADGASRFLTAVRQRPDAAGELLARADQTQVPMVVALAGADTVLIDGAVDYHATPVIAVTRYLEDLDWGLVAKLDASEVLAPLDDIRRALVFLAISLALVSTLGGAILGGLLSRAGTRLQKELDARIAAEGRFRDVVATSPVAMLVISPGGEVELANRAAGRLMGLDSERLRGLTLEELVTEDDRQQVLAHLLDVGTAVGVASDTRIDTRVRHSSGRSIHVELGVTPVETPDGRLLVTTLVDLTERENAARVLRERAEALERSNRELDDFAYVASHDLKAPLRGIAQLASFIEEDASEVLSSESLKDLATMQARVTRLDRLLDGLLAYSRVGRGDGGSEWVDPGEVLAEVKELYVPETFRLHVQPDLPPVHVPPAVVDLVFRNLVMNAVKHHDEESGTIRIEGYGTPAGAHFVVEDDGPGIRPEWIGKVFQIFQTLKPRDEVEGSGMGLALVKKAMESHGGSVHLEPREGRGARFHLHWPSPASGHAQGAA